MQGIAAKPDFLGAINEYNDTCGMKDVSFTSAASQSSAPLPHPVLFLITPKLCSARSKPRTQQSRPRMLTKIVV